MDLERAEATGDPIGTYEMLIKYNLNPKRFGSCSSPSSQNKGCPNFHHCRFLDYRDRLNGRVGPGNVGVLMITPQNAAANHIMSCFDYYRGGADGVRRNSDENGWVVQIVGLEGASVKDRGSRRSHPKKDPQCPQCQSGTCNKMTQYVEPREIPVFPRLGDANKGTEASNFAIEMRELAMKNLDNDRTAAALKNSVPASSSPEVPSHEGPATPRLNRQ